MKEIINIGGRLAIICMVAATALGIVNSVTAPRIADYQQRLLLEALTAVSGGNEVSAERIAVSDDGFPAVNGYYLLRNQDQTAGYIISLTAGGYGGPMEVIAGYTDRGELINARLLANAETPGLGKEAEKASYMAMFVGAGSDQPIPVKKSDLAASQADAISGATVTFSGVAKALASGSEYVRNL